MNEKNPFDSIPEDPNFVLVNPDEPDVNPQIWSETKGGTEGVFTGEKKAPRKKPSPRPKTSGSPYVTKRFLAVTLVLAVIVSSALGAFLGSRMSGGGSYSNLDSNSSLESATGSKLTIQQIYKKNADAVVEISTEVPTKSVLGNSVSQGAGSGVIVNKKGYIATNYHVIEGAKKITVRLRNGKSRSASVVGKSKNVQVGDLAVAIGNPLGQLGGTTTSGIISALDRQLSISGKKLTLLQTDTAINPGNSGGGLFNGKGELIGLVVAKGSGTGIEGLGFAIPSDTAAPIIDDIIKNGTIVEKPAAGISIFDVTEDQKAEYNVDKAGVYIHEVYGSHAKKAGLKSGDRIIKLDGKKVTSSNGLIQAIQKKKVGDTVTFTVERNGKEVTAKVKLEKASQFENQTEDSSQGEQ